METISFVIRKGYIFVIKNPTVSAANEAGQ
jgi:hypothetical protein